MLQEQRYVLDSPFDVQSDFGNIRTPPLLLRPPKCRTRKQVEEPSETEEWTEEAHTDGLEVDGLIEKEGTPHHPRLLAAPGADGADNRSVLSYQPST